MSALTAIYETLGTTVVYLLVIAGFWLTVTTLYVPGLGLPELGAVLALLAGGIGLLVLPSNLFGVLLLLGALACFLALIYFRRYWLFIVVGFALHLLGSIFLFRQGAGPSIIAVLVVNAAAIIYHQLILHPGLNIQGTASPLDPNTFIGQNVLVESTIDPVGTVRVEGEAWSAVAEELIEAGTLVRIVGRDGPYLHVTPIRSVDAVVERPSALN